MKRQCRKLLNKKENPQNKFYLQSQFACYVSSISTKPWMIITVWLERAVTLAERQIEAFMTMNLKTNTAKAKAWNKQSSQSRLSNILKLGFKCTRNVNKTSAN